jgi:hypothetical protein
LVGRRRCGTVGGFQFRLKCVKHRQSRDSSLSRRLRDVDPVVIRSLWSGH